MKAYEIILWDASKESKRIMESDDLKEAYRFCSSHPFHSQIYRTSMADRYKVYDSEVLVILED